MFQADKDNYLDLASSICDMHKVISDTKDFEMRTGFLSDCQQAAIAIGDSLDEEYKMYPELYKEIPNVISALEEYCEQVYHVSQCEDIDVSRQVEKLERLILKTKKDLRRMPIRYRVVFFPYKADMWDSLESIYLSAKKDARCEAIVCPIPYYEKDAMTNEWIFKYEGARFP